MTRDEALSAGHKKYFTGKPCRNGHTADRYTVSGGCVICLRRYVQKYKTKPSGWLRRHYDLHPADALRADAFVAELQRERVENGSGGRFAAVSQADRVAAALAGNGRGYGPGGRPDVIPDGAIPDGPTAVPECPRCEADIDPTNPTYCTACGWWKSIDGAEAPRP